MTTSLLKSGFKTALAEAFYNEVLSNASNYYYFLGKPLEWSGGTTAVETPENTLISDLELRKDIVFFKKVTGSDISFTIPRYDWASGQVYDQYDDQIGASITYAVTAVANTLNITGNFDLTTFGQGWHVTGTGIPAHTYVDEATPTQIKLTKSTTAPVTSITLTNRAKYKVIASDDGAISLETSRFYVLTDDLNVYKCLFNNNGAISTVKPFSTTHELVHTNDGYVWKYMYTIPTALANKFLSQTDMPVTTAVKSSYYSKGAITSATVEFYGSGYLSTDNLIVTGDGHATDNAYKINNINIDDSGDGYTTTPNVTISSPYPSAVQFQTDTAYLSGQYVYVDTEFEERIFYEVVSGGTSSGVTPSHTGSEPVINGACTLKFVGLRAKVTPTLSSQSIITKTFSSASVSTTNDTITISSHGFATGDRVRYNNGAGTSIVPLSELQSYYIIEVDSNTIKLALTVADAIDEISIDLTGAGTGTTHTVETVENKNVSTIDISGIIANIPIQDPGYGYNPSLPPQVSIVGDGTGATAIAEVSYDGHITGITITSRGSGYTTATVEIDPPDFNSKIFDGSSSSIVNTTNNTITINDHGFITGDRVTYDNGNVTSVGGLLENTSYYVIKIDDDVFKLSTTYAGAFNQTNIVDITGTGGSGANHTIADYYITAVADVDLYYGYGYNIYPTVTIDDPFEYDYDYYVDYEAETTILIDKIVRVSNRFYRVVAVTGGTPKLGLTVPETITGTMVSGDCTLEYVGKTASLTLSASKTAAYLVPVVEDGQIISVIAQDPGVGYTTAAIKPGRQTSEEAIITANLSIGNLDTRQANTELLATPGTIDAIEVLHSGTGYSYVSINVQIFGDGEGCTAEAVIVDGAITKINVTNSGKNYTYATVNILGTSTLQAYARAIISPILGHGKDAISELFAKDIALSSSIAQDKNQGFVVDNDYRQVGLIKNPRLYNSTQRYTKISGSPCYTVTGDFDYTVVQKDMLMTDIHSHRFVVIAKPSSEPLGDVQILVQSIDNADVTLTVPSVDNPEQIVDNQFKYYDINTSSYKYATITAVTQPNIDKYSGKVLFIDNKEKFQPTEEQTLSIKTVIRL